MYVTLNTLSINIFFNIDKHCKYLSMNTDTMKEEAAIAAVKQLSTLTTSPFILGVGTGSTVNLFIKHLPLIQDKIISTVSTSQQTTKLLEQLNFKVIDPNLANTLPFYVDGADEIDNKCNLIKGGGGALTMEKIIASKSKHFICIADESKQSKQLGEKHHLPLEVLPEAIQHVSAQCKSLGAQSTTTRPNFTTKHGNMILDIQGLDLTDPETIEKKLNNLPGVVCNGIFAHHRPQMIIIGQKGKKTEIITNASTL